MIICRATSIDIPFIDSVLTHPDVWEYVSDDLTPEGGYTCKPGVMNPAVYYLLSYPVGVSVAFPWNSITYEMHIATLPDQRGPIALTFAKSCVEWMFTHTQARKLVANVPCCNRPVYALAYRAGMRIEGVNKNSWIKKGKLHNQYLMGICKKEELCPQR